jgi:ribonuclease T2
MLVFFFGGVLGVLCAPPESSSAAASPSSGGFDYYVLNLSWAPEFCYSRPDNAECRGHFGFIVHGLWPQYRRGGYPESCDPQPGPRHPAGMLDIMPDLHLIQHEWITHGACTGLAADDYFALIRRLFHSLRIPPKLVTPSRPFSLSPQELKQEFEQANPALTDSAIAVECGRGSYLVAVEICFTKDGKPTPCAGDIRDCRRPEIHVPRVQ